MTLAIVLTTFNRLKMLQECVAAIRKYTTTPYTLYIADGGSKDGSREWINAEPGVIPVTRHKHSGVSWNMNHGMWEANKLKPDYLITVEEDAPPCVEGWELPWLEGARLHGHVSYTKEAVIDPKQQTAWITNIYAKAGEIMSFTRCNMDTVGYFAPHWNDFDWPLHHNEFTERSRQFFNQDLPHGHAWGLSYGVTLIDHGLSSRTQDQWDRADVLWRRLRYDGPVYRFPWRDDTEKAEFLSSHEEEVI